LDQGSIPCISTSTLLFTYGLEFKKAFMVEPEINQPIGDDMALDSS